MLLPYTHGTHHFREPKEERRGKELLDGAKDYLQPVVPPALSAGEWEQRAESTAHVCARWHSHPDSDATARTTTSRT